MTTTLLPPLPPEDFIWFDPEYGDMPLAHSSTAMQAYATAARADLEAQLKQWKSVFGHLGTADECGNEWIRLQDENQRLRAALGDCLDWMEALRSSGDMGYWEWEDDAYTQGTAALEKQP